MIQVCKWEEFQHFKGRDPIWIKLYRRTRHKREWRQLSGDAAKLLVDLWMIASEADEPGRIELTTAELAWEVRKPSEEVDTLLQEIVSHSFIKMVQDDINAERDDIPHALARDRDREREETETEALSSESAVARTHARTRNGATTSDPCAGLDALARKSVLALYGDGLTEGTDERVWGDLKDPVTRKTSLMIAVSRWKAEGHPRFKSNLFRAILERVIAEQGHHEGERSGLWG